MSREAMKLAVRSLKELVPDDSDHAPAIQGQRKRQENAIKALQEALAEQPAQQEPVISTAHGPWIPSTHPGEEGESYCKRCLLRDKFLGSRQCDPHIVPPEQPAQQESVGYVAENGVVDWNICAPPIMTDLYTSPPQRKPLTDEEIGKAWSVADGEHNASASVKRRITRAIEAKLKEKNT